MAGVDARAVPVALDTNFLLLPFQWGIDFEVEVEQLVEEPHFFVVLRQCIDELKEMAARKRRFSPASRAALAFASQKGFVVESGFPGTADTALLEYCKAKSAVLCTLDAALRRKAKRLGIRVVFLRGKSRLTLA